MQNYCIIDKKDNTNKCFDPELHKIYDNKDTGVYKVNSINTPSSMQNNSTIGLTQSLNYKNTTIPPDNSTLAYAHAGHSSNNNTTLTTK